MCAVRAGNRIPLGIMDDLRSRAARFAESWAGRGDEKSETQQYWRDLLDKVLLIPDTSDGQALWFERRTALGGFIDALMIQARVLVEQKSLGVDLDKPGEHGHARPTGETVCGRDAHRRRHLASTRLTAFDVMMIRTP